ncbi:MAG: hypothetical protein ACKVHE_27265 [Planctomycetales bacterium]
MDSRELAVQQFDLIRESVQKQSLPGAAAMAWLQNYAMPAIAEYWERPQFQNQATWSIRELDCSAASDERRFIDQLDCCIRRASKTILALAAKSTVSRLIQENLVNTSPVLAREDVFVGQDEGSRIPSTFSAAHGAFTHPNSLRRFASGDFKLADINDYFEPVQEFVAYDDKQIQRGELILSVNPAFIPIGDLIVQTMLRRIGVAEALIRGSHQTVLKAVSQTVSSDKAMTAEAADAMTEFDSLVSTVRPKFVNSPEAQLRQSCCVLAQVYAAKNPAADCEWLGLPEPLVNTGRNGVDLRLGSRRGPQIFFVVANALSELERLYQGEQKSSAVDEAIAQCRLVIVEESQRVWWDQHELLIGFSPTEYRTLLLLAMGASGQRVVSDNDVYSNSASGSRWPTMISRLKKRLPDQLAATIMIGKIARTYRLDLPGEQVHVARR